MAADPPGGDDAFVTRLLAREPGAWEKLLAEHGGPIARACRRAIRDAGAPADEASIADAAAEVLRHLLKNDGKLLRQFRPGASLGAYLQVIARSKTLSAPRPRPLPRWLAEEAPPRDLLLETERVDRLRHALASLDPRDARLLRAFYLEGRPFRELSQALGIAEGSLGTYLARARGKLRDALGEDLLER